MSTCIVEHGDSEQPSREGGGHQDYSILYVSGLYLKSVCAALTVYQTLIYKENKLLTVAEEFLTVLEAGRC